MFRKLKVYSEHPHSAQKLCPSAHLLCNRQMSSNSVVYWGTGRRKTSVARASRPRQRNDHHQWSSR